MLHTQAKVDINNHQKEANTKIPMKVQGVMYLSTPDRNGKEVRVQGVIYLSKYVNKQSMVVHIIFPHPFPSQRSHVHYATRQEICIIQCHTRIIPTPTSFFLFQSPCNHLHLVYWIHRHSQRVCLVINSQRG